MKKIDNYSDWLEYEGASEGSGRSEKIWLKEPGTNIVGLFKYPKSDTSKDHISELLAADIGQSICVDCAKTEIGYYKNSIGALSYQISGNEKNLIEGVNLITAKYPTFNPDTLCCSDTGEYYSLEMVIPLIEEYELLFPFLKMLFFDFLIGNSDRHQSNWALLSQNNQFSYCPLYDNGSSLCCRIDETLIQNYLGKDQLRFNSLINSKSRSRIRIDKTMKKEPTHLQVIEFLLSNYLSPELKIWVNDLPEKLDDLRRKGILDDYQSDLLSDNRKALIDSFLKGKLELLNRLLKKGGSY